MFMEVNILNQEEYDIKKEEIAQKEEEQKKKLEERINYVYNKYKDETPDEWERSLSFFYGPTIFALMSIIFVYLKHHNLLMSILVIAFAFGWFTYNLFEYMNQRIYIYSTKLVYHYGLWNHKEKEFYYDTPDIIGCQCGRQSRIQKLLSYGNFFIINIDKKGFRLKNIGNPQELENHLKEKVNQYYQEFDPEYRLPEKEIL